MWRLGPSPCKGQRSDNVLITDSFINPVTYRDKTRRDAPIWGSELGFQQGLKSRRGCHDQGQIEKSGNVQDWKGSSHRKPERRSMPLSGTIREDTQCRRTRMVLQGGLPAPAHPQLQHSHYESLYSGHDFWPPGNSSLTATSLSISLTTGSQWFCWTRKAFVPGRVTEQSTTPLCRSQP